MPKIENPYLLDESLEPSVFNLYCYDSETGLELFTSSLTESSLTKDLPDPTEVKAGQDNSTRYVLKEGASLKLTVKDAQSRQDVFARKFGTAIKETTAEDTVFAYHMPKNYEVKAGASDAKEITLDMTPYEGEEVVCYKVTDGKMIESSKATLVNNKITIADTTVKVGDTIKVTGFKFKVPEGSKHMKITADSVGGKMLVVAEGKLFDNSFKVVAKKQYIFPNAVMSENATISGKTKKEEVADETTFNILKDSALDALGEVVYLTV